MGFLTAATVWGRSPLGSLLRVRAFTKWSAHPMPVGNPEYRAAGSRSPPDLRAQSRAIGIGMTTMRLGIGSFYLFIPPLNLSAGQILMPNFEITHAV